MTDRRSHTHERTWTSGRQHKVVLYNPQAVFFTMPLALVTVGSHLNPERYDVVVIDGRLEDDPVAAVTAQLDEALCLGVTVLTGAPIRDALMISRAAKAYRPDLPVIWGGWHPSMFGEDCLTESSVDVTVQGQGEATLAEVVDRLASGESLAECSGCTYRTPTGEVCCNPPRALQDLNTFRPHDYSLIKVEQYFARKGKRQLDYISSQGCAFRCAFCADPFVYNRKWLRLHPARIGEEIETLWHQYHFEDVSFQDETFFSHAPRVLAIAEEFLRRQLPITWAATMRADQCWRLSEEIFATCKQSGLRRVLVGVESGAQDMLDRIQKDITLEQIVFTAERCKKYDVAVHFPFIVGFPGESDASVQATLAMAKRLRAMSPKFQTPIFYFKPYPGTSITHEAIKDGFGLPSSLAAWADFDFVGAIGPWVSLQKYRLIESFKFYQDQSWAQDTAWQRLLQQLARWRLRHDIYRLPVEKVLSHWISPPQALS
jgi:anaerobic magnesium-protoporphyrin IX monomethyl ester cyclase